MAAASRSGYDSMRGEMRLWEAELIEWRCALPLSEVRRLRGSIAAAEVAALCREAAALQGVAPSVG